MFWNYLNNQKKENCYEVSLLHAIEHLEEGDVSFLPAAYCVFAFPDSHLTARSGRAIRTLLASYTIQQMIRLSERFRQYTSLEWSIDWQKVRIKDRKDQFESEEDYKYALIVGSFHPNGYFREQCVCELAGYPETLTYLVLRMNDWVADIRIRAVETIKNRLDQCSLEEIYPAFQALEKVKGSKRREDRDLVSIEERMRKRMEQDMGGTPVYLILKHDFSVRKSVYRYLFSGKILEREKAEYLLAKEKHSFCQSVIISGILAYYDCSQEQIDGYLLHKSACVRRKAMEKKYELLKDAWPGLSELLLDKNRGIRELAVFILEHHRGFDVPGFYISHLKDEKPEIAIIGLSESGSREMAEQIRPFLTHGSEAVVRAAVRALGKLMEEEGEELYWKYLFDDRISVSKAAYRAIHSSRIHYGADKLYESFCSCDSAHVKRYLFGLILQENSWSCLPYLILMYQEPDMEEVRSRILAAMRCRSVYTVIAKEQGQRIEKLLEEFGNKLPGHLEEEIRFDLKFVVKG